jgi:hypothetical protein
VRYKITFQSKKRCPELVGDNGHYKCLLIERDIEAKEALLSGDCDNPALAHLKKKFKAAIIAKEYFPEATDEQIGVILWEHTGYPVFWNIPEDGWTDVQCLKKQLAELKRMSQSVMSL